MAQVVTGTAVVDVEGLSTREINVALTRLLQGGATDIEVRNPVGQHCLAVALKTEARIHFMGSVGWYAAGMNDGAHIVIDGNCGWGLAECQMGGRVEVHGNAGSGTSVSIRGGLVFIRGDCGARAGISMKGGTLIIGGSAGYLSGFMMQRGTIIICGDAADGLGDSMYEGTIYVGGKVAAYGADAVEKSATDEDRHFLRTTLKEFRIDADRLDFKKVESGRRLWNFSKKEPELWRSAL
ncbi:MAG TPA: glutamate synthase [Candidatus Dormibacteraeota bacterium]|nr:glutamate synthase [Candidatus Dormibacteraeota bacterium]